VVGDKSLPPHSLAERAEGRVSGSMRVVRCVADWALRVSEVLATALLALTLLTVLYEILARYLRIGYAGWTGEVARYLMICFVYLSMPIAYRRGQHVALTAVRDRLPVTMQNMVELIVHSGILFAGVFLTWQGLIYLPKLMRQRSPSLGIPMAYPYAAVLVGAILLVIQAVYLVLESVKRLKERR